MEYFKEGSIYSRAVVMLCFTWNRCVWPPDPWCGADWPVSTEVLVPWLMCVQGLNSNLLRETFSTANYSLPSRNYSGTGKKTSKEIKTEFLSNQVGTVYRFLINTLISSFSFLNNWFFNKNAFATLKNNTFRKGFELNSLNITKCCL